MKFPIGVERKPFTRRLGGGELCDEQCGACGQHKRASKKSVYHFKIVFTTPERGCVRSTSRSTSNIQGAAHFSANSAFQPAAAGLRHSRAPNSRHERTRLSL